MQLELSLFYPLAAELFKCCVEHSELEMEKLSAQEIASAHGEDCGCRNDTNGALGAEGPLFNVVLFFGSISRENEGIIESDSCNELDGTTVFVSCTKFFRESTPPLIYGRDVAFSAMLSCKIGTESHCSSKFCVCEAGNLFAWGYKEL